MGEAQRLLCSANGNAYFGGIFELYQMPQPGSLLHKVQSFIKRKVSQQYKFNQQFESGVWEGLKGVAELGRYSIIAGYVRFYCKRPRVLDLGCGEGILQKKISAVDYQYYLGVDFSDVAINNANEFSNAATHFEVGDLNKLNVPGKFDAIIYNESIYYLNNPEAAITALCSQLNDGGIFIFSIVDKHGKVETGLWERINGILTLHDTTRVTNREGNSWTIQVYKKKLR